jgi:hypothetical protein
MALSQQVEGSIPSALTNSFICNADSLQPALRGQTLVPSLFPERDRPPSLPFLINSIERLHTLDSSIIE